MPRFWFDVFTRATWDEARAIGFSVSGFSRTKLATVRRVQPGDVLICYLKGQMRLVGALRVTGTAYSADEPRIWSSQVFPARLPVEPLVILSESAAVDFVSLLPRMSFYDAANIRRSWARLQGSPTLLSDEDGQVLLDAIEAADASLPVDIVPFPAPGPLPTPDQPDEAGEAPVVVVALSPLERLTQELHEAQRDISQPARLERAIASAFRFLGLDVQLKGQPGATDVIVESRLGLESYRVVVDAKSSRTGKVSEAQINWAAIADHRQRSAADYAMVVGERFAGGNLTRFANDFGVALLDVESLTVILRLHSEAPYAASDFRDLFSTPGLAPSVMADLKQKQATTVRHWQLVSEIIRLVDGFSRSDPPLTPTLGHLHGALMGSYFMGESHDRPTGPPPSQQDVLDAVGFLASRTVAILRPVTPAETAGYRLALSPSAALQRLRAMEDAIRSMSTPTAGVHRSVGPFAELSDG